MCFTSAGCRDEKVEVMKHECLLSCGGLLRFCVGVMKRLDRFTKFFWNPRLREV